MTLRNKLNLAFILLFSTWVIFFFDLSGAQYAGLFLFLLFGPKAFWVTFDYLPNVIHRPQPDPTVRKTSETKIELVS
jgi:hypothetical protein